MDQENESIDVATLDEYEWRALLREWTPFLHKQLISTTFSDRGPPYGYDLGGYEGQGYVALDCEWGDELRHFISLRWFSIGGGEYGIYVVLTKIYILDDGRDVQIRFWSKLSSILERLGIEFKQQWFRDVWDGHEGMLEQSFMDSPVFTISCDSDDKDGVMDVMNRIQHEIISAWIQEPSDRDREALREESEKANPAPVSKGRAGQL